MEGNASDAPWTMRSVSITFSDVLRRGRYSGPAEPALSYQCEAYTMQDPTLRSPSPTAAPTMALTTTLSTAPISGPAGAALEPVATFCGTCSCGCPELFLDHAAGPARRVVLTDDFGQRVEMSLEQLSYLVSDVKKGVLDHLC